jgi:hypothetical protein
MREDCEERRNKEDNKGEMTAIGAEHDASIVRGTARHSHD